MLSDKDGSCSSLLPQPQWCHLCRLPEGGFWESEGCALSVVNAPGERESELVCRPEGEGVK